MTPAIVDSDLTLYITSSYVASYFFLMIFLSLGIMLSTNQTQKCKTRIYFWLEISSIYYLIASMTCLAVVLALRRVLPSEQTVNLGLILCLFISYRGHWPYAVLTVVDLSHFYITIWGTREFFEDISQIVYCYLELPIHTNFMFIMLIVGYAFTFRAVITVFHFWLGPWIWG